MTAPARPSWVDATRRAGSNDDHKGVPAISGVSTRYSFMVDLDRPNDQVYGLVPALDQAATGGYPDMRASANRIKLQLEIAIPRTSINTSRR